jgi:hypothetical protein
MAFGGHLQRSVHSITNHLRHGVYRAARGIVNAAKRIDQLHGRIRPIYDAARPHLQPHVNTGMADEYLRGYDAIRRSILAANSALRG